MSCTRTPAHCCKIWQQITGERCLSKRIIGPRFALLREAVLLLSLTFSHAIYDQFHEITDASWHIQLPRLINLEDLGLSAARQREEHQCQNINEKDMLEELEVGHGCRMGREGNLKWILKQFVWFCFVADTLERGFPSVLLSPWPVSASLVCLSHLSSCCGTCPLRPCHRPQRARPYNQSYRRATHTTGTSL